MDEEGTDILMESICCKNRNMICNLLDAAIPLASDVANYVFNEDDNVFELYNNCDEKEKLATLYTSDNEILDEIIEFFDELSVAEGFHAIEHILLRKRTEEDSFMPVQLNDESTDCEDACVEVKDPYSFRMTILLPSWPERFRNIRFRKLIERTLREEAPAHIYLKICWITHCEMKDFEETYEDWLELLPSISDISNGEQRLESIGDLEPGSEEMLITSEYRIRLRKLIEKLHSMSNVHPMAVLHDCGASDSENPEVTLNQTSLGTY
jgi:hypothetical protein